MSLRHYVFVKIFTPFHKVREGETFQLKDDDKALFVRIREMVVDGKKVNAMPIPFENILYRRAEHQLEYIFVHHARKVNLVCPNSVTFNHFSRSTRDGENEDDYYLSFGT